MIAVKISNATRYQYDKNTKTLECWNWCIEHFGLPVTGNIRWSWDTHYYFRFKNEADATAFALKWA